MKHGVIIEYLKCRADLNFEVNCKVNDTIAAKWDAILFGKWIVFTNIKNLIIFFKKEYHAFKSHICFINLFMSTLGSLFLT